MPVFPTDEVVVASGRGGVWWTDRHVTAVGTPPGPSGGPMQETGMTRRFDPGSELGNNKPTSVPNPREVARAVGVGEILPWYQPLIDLGDGTVCALEALARWDSPQRGMVYPADFIATAEESHLIIELDRHMAR